jgi:ribosome hibernation promoting factor
MELSFTARRGSIPETVRRHTEERMERLQKFEKRPVTAHIYVENEGGQKTVEAHVTVVGGNTFVAHGTGRTLRAAVDAATDRAERQLKRDRERYKNHQAPKPTAS